MSTVAGPGRLLERIEECLVGHGGDLGGWTRLEGEALQIFDGRVTLRATVEEKAGGGGMMVHAHVLAALHEHDDEVLDACLFGMGSDSDEALGQAAVLWMSGVAGPIRSFLDDKPVCMTCRANADGDEGPTGDYGLPAGVRAFVGPAFARAIRDETIIGKIDDARPWFRYAAESAAPRRVHLAKATVVAEKGAWRRELEIDGHDVSHRDPEWPAGVPGPEFGYLTRFAVL